MNVFATKKLPSYKPVRMSFVRIRLLPSAFGSEITWDCAQIFKLKKFSNRWENVSRSLMDHFSIPHWVAMSTLRMQRTKTEYLFAMKCRLQLNQLKIFHSDVCIFNSLAGDQIMLSEHNIEDLFTCRAAWVTCDTCQMSAREAACEAACEAVRLTQHSESSETP